MKKIRFSLLTTLLTFLFGFIIFDPGDNKINLNGKITTQFSHLNNFADIKKDFKSDNEIDRNWYSTVIENIKKEEYNITYCDEIKAYQSPNRANNFRFIYHSGGFTVKPRTTKIPLFDMSDKMLKENDKKYKYIPDWNIKFSLTGFGKEKTEQFDGKDLQVSGNTAFIEDDNIKITYLNDEKGMRQDFIVKEKPEGNSDRLILTFRLDTKLKTKITRDGIRFFNKKNEQILQYSSLCVSDADGKYLNAEFRKINSKKYNIIVNDENAVYPVTIDPLSSTPNWTAEVNVPAINFGFSVSTAGDVNGDGYSDVIVGVPLFSVGQPYGGGAFVYCGSSSGLSLTSDWWIAETHQAYAYLGWSVSTAGDVNGDGYGDVIVGAKGYTNGQINEGRAYVYYGSSSGLSLTANWTVESNQAGAYFGYSVSTAGDVNGDGYSDVIVGALQYDNGQTDEGSVFVYHGSSLGLSSTPYWTVESNQAGAYFGSSVSTAGDVNGDGYNDVIIGAWYYSNTTLKEGRAYVYHGSSSGLSLNPNWIKESNLINAYFGCSVSSAGDVNSDGYSDVIIGAYGYDGYVYHDLGRAFVYCGSSTGLSLNPNWIAEGDQEASRFGWSVSTAGDVNGDGYGDVIVGANGYNNERGIVFVYHGSSSGLSLNPYWSAESDQEGANFGNSVSTAGDVNGDGYSDAIVGAPNYNGHGMAFVYHALSSGLSSTSNWIAEGNQSQAWFGNCVSTAGDVNGDGYSDLIIGAPFYTGALQYSGAVFVYYGGTSGANWSAYGTQSMERFGYSVSTAGDINGDGYCDIIIGAPTYSNGQTGEGRTYVYYGSSSGLSLTPDWTSESDQANASFGWSVSSAGDIDGDGYSDIIIGAVQYDFNLTDNGRIFLFYGSSSGLSESSGWAYSSDKASAGLGRSVSTAGDVNGDGYSDIIAGAFRYSNGETDEGKVYVFYGTYSGLNDNPDWTFESNQAGAYLGYSVSTAGDINGDGYCDIIAGAYRYDNPEIDEGMVFVFYGSSSGLNSSLYTTRDCNQSSAQFGCCVSTAGDVNGDGYSDIIIGANFFDNPEVNEGMAFLYYGSSSGISSLSNWVSESNQGGSNFSNSVSSIGDFNGDGYSDVIIGAYTFDNGLTDEGMSFVFYGNEGTGIRNTISQCKPGTNNLIQPLGLSDVNGSVRLTKFSKSPFGRTDGKLVWEIKPNGVPFSGPYSTAFTGTQSTYFDLSTTGANLLQDITGITTMYEYKWRIRTKYSPVNNPYQVYGPWKYYTSYMPLPWGCFKAQDSPLPVELLSLSHSVIKNNVTLKWTTLKETNNKGFSVERYDNGKKDKWAETIFIEGKGNSNNPVSYEYTDKNISKGSYKYRLKQTDYNGNFEYHNLPQDVVIGAPDKFDLSQNYPNPFNPLTKISFALPSDSRVTLKIYDITGREIKTLINNEVKTADWYTVEFNADGISSGVYFYRLSAEGTNIFVSTKKMIYLK